MTTRTTNPEKTPCEKAAEKILLALRASIPVAFAQENVKSQMKYETFLGVMAGYLENKSLRDWCETLGAEPPEPERV